MREQQLQNILRHMPAGIATLLGPELRYGFVNEAMRTLLGADIREGQPLAEHSGILSPDLLEVMRQVYSSGRPYVAKAYALPLADAAGGPPTPRYFDLALEPLHDDHDQPLGLLLFAVDVTGQEQARQRAHELALETRRLDARLRVLTETAPQITFSVDAAGHFEYVSPQWYYFTGQPPTADLNAMWPLLIHPDDRLRVLYRRTRRGPAAWAGATSTACAATTASTVGC